MGSKRRQVLEITAVSADEGRDVPQATKRLKREHSKRGNLGRKGQASPSGSGSQDLPAVPLPPVLGASAAAAQEPVPQAKENSLEDPKQPCKLQLARRGLLQLGQMVEGLVVKRPSATVKTPYVADVKLADGSLVLAHTPAMDCAGMIVPGCKVHLTANPIKEKGPQTKTSHTVQITEDLREGGSIALVGAHPHLAERLALAALQLHLLPELGAYHSIEKQKTFGDTRVDFVLLREGGGKTLVEVKNVVCADYPAGDVPEERTKVGVYTSEDKPYERTAIFPHGAKKKGIGVVSDRAIKHLHELVKLQEAQQDPEGCPVSCAVLFVVNRSDCTSFRPCHEADMMLARMLQHAEGSGVQVLAYDVAWEGGAASWGKRLPVRYGKEVRADDLDWDHLERVLDFNATDPRTHWKSAKAGSVVKKGAKKAKDGNRD